MAIKVKCLLYSICICMAAASVFAQGEQKELKIGDTIPDLTISELVHSKKKSVKLSDLYKKGGLIIDFWAPWCLQCVQSTPALDSLAGKLPSLSVLLVSHADSLSSAGFFKKHSGMNISNLVISSDDGILNQYFKHIYIPHEAWIDKNGVVRLITSDRAITQKNLTAFLSGKTPNLKLKKDAVNFKFWKPYHVEDSSIEYRSIITHHTDSLGGGAVLNGARGDGTSKRVFLYNSPILGLFWVAYVGQLTTTYNWDYVELHTSDSVRYYYPLQNRKLFSRSRYNIPGLDYSEQLEKWVEENAYCYDLILPKPVTDEVFSQYMFDDLKRYFNVQASIEKRNILCTIVTTNSNYDSNRIRRYLPPPGHKFHPSECFKPEKNRLTIKNRTIEQIFAYLNAQFKTEFPVVNETGIDYPLSMQIDFPEDVELSDKVLVQILNELGFSLKKETRYYPILVLYDLNHQAPFSINKGIQL